MKKKILSLFLALAMCLSLLPTAAFAADGAQDPEQEGGPAGVSAPQTGAANSEIAVQATGGHSQYHTEICNTYGCTKHQTLTWSAISSVDQLTSASGETKGYYLTTDLELTEPWTPTGTVNLCLSGHSITLNAGTDTEPHSVITVKSGVQLNISNCISLAPGGTYDGIYYGGPYIQHAKNAVGPGITVLNGGTVELFDGDVTQNSDGVVVENGGTLSVRGDISENTGAGVRLENGGTLNISGGNIESNKGCGVDVALGSTFNVSGGTKILSNTKEGQPCNVYLHDGATMQVRELSTARIGVTVEALPDQGAFVPVTSDGKASRNDQNCITSDNTSYRVFYSTSKSAGNLVLDARPTLLHADHDSKTFINSLSSSDSKLLINGEEAGTYSYNGTTYYNLPEGNYYLEGDLTLSYGLLAYSTNVVLCLNGHNITVTGTSYVIYTAKKTSSGSYTFTLTDCTDEPGTLTHSYNQYASGGVCVRDGSFIMRGGKISGNNSGVYVYQGNEFKIYGGEISGNKGYGVSLTPDSKSNIYMTVGGTAKITGNWENGEYNAATGLYERGTGTAKNVLFTAKPYKYITVDSSLTEGAEIGVTIWRTVTAERDCVAVATYGTFPSADVTPYVGYFKSDSDAYKVWSSNNNVVIGVWNSEDQTHPVCGAVCNHKDASGDPVHEDIVWTPVSSESGLNNNGDNIYLTQDIELSRTWEISAGGTVNLCLNGHTIKANGDFDAITLTSNTNTLNICDCSESGSGKITHGTKGDGTTYSGAGVYMTAAGSNKATVNMYGGTITGNRNTFGAGVRLDRNSTFNMYGGSITGNEAYVTAGSTGEGLGGGVYVGNDAQFSMSGGSITGNTAAQGGGVYYSESGLTVSGNVQIKDNHDASGSANNVYVVKSTNTDGCRHFYIGEGGLDKNAEIGITFEGTIATGERIIFALWAERGYYDGNFTYDNNNNGDYSFKKELDPDEYHTRGTHVVSLYNGLPHKHAICGKTAESCTDSSKHTDVTWTPLTSKNGQPYKGNTALTTGQFNQTQGYVLPAGHYYLSDALNLDKPLLIKNGVYLCLNGQTLTVQSSNSAIIIDTGCDLTLCDCSEEQTGKITHAASATGRGVYMGTSTGTANNYNGRFTMYGGNISGNRFTGGSGAGVYMEGKGTFNMHGGSITGNTTTVDRTTGGVYVSGGEFNMTGGSITATGGGVKVDGKGTFNMSGDAVISNNNAYGGGGVSVSKGTFNMSGNAAITGNSVNYGGGVYVYGATAPTAAVFNMSGNASISGNSAKYGGGVYVSGYGRFTMNGGSITGNNVSEAGGVYVIDYDATMTVSGDVQITDNWKNGTKNADGVYEQGENGSANNFYLFGDSDDRTEQQTVTIGTDGLTKNARIGIITNNTPTAEAPIKIATGATNNLSYYTNIFTPDVTGQGYTITQTDNKLYLSAHQHSWKYELCEDGKTITATCTDTTCTSPNGGKVTIVAPDENTLTYDGNTKEARLENTLTTGVTLPDIKYYYKIGEQEYQLETGAKPTNAKSYRAEITVVGGVNASVSYEIKKATPQASDFLFSGPNDPTYDGNPKTATVTSTKIDADHIKVKYYQGETVVERPTEAGTYTVKIDVTESTNYKAAEAELTKDSWTFTILQADYTGQKSDKTIDIVKGRSTAQSGTLTAADFFPEGTELPAGAKIASVTPASGTMMASVTVNDGTLTYTSNTNITATENESYTVTISTTNYNNFTVTLTFRPADKQPQTGFGFKDVVNSKVTKTYGDDDFKIEATGQVNGSNVTGYDSSNENVATVANDGTVTIKGAGTAVIKATASATDDYAQGVATYELTVSPKTLTADDLEFTQSSIFTKTYDGDTACTTATVQIKDSAKVTSGDELPTVTGTYAYNSKDVKDAKTVTFTSTASDNTNYILPAGLTVKNAASITKRVLTVGTVTATSKKYDRTTDAEACIASVPLNGVVDGDSLELDTPTTDGSYYFTADFIDANAGQNKTINGTVVLYDNKVTANYTFKDAADNEAKTATFTATGEITPADGGSKGDVERTQKFTDGDPKTETIAWKQLLPAGQTWNYISEYYSASSVTVDHRTDDNGALTYTITGGKENDVVVFTVSAKCNNYNDFTYTVRVTLTARDSQALEFKGVENGKVTKTYGNQPFTQTVTGEKTDVTYASSNERVATVDNDGKVTIVGAGDTTITATAAQTNDYASASASYTLTVNKLRIAVPAPGKNKLEYDGTTQTYMPDRLDTAYCTITDNTAKDVRANNAHYTATVSLTDTANTEWATATESNISSRTYEFWITPKPITVTALDKKITAGQPAPDLTTAKLGEDYTITGLYDGDSLGSIVLYYADPADTTTEVTPDTGKAGTYAIVARLDGTGNPNYAPTFVSGTLTIANRPSSGGSYTPTYPVNTPSKTENGSVSSDVKNASKGSTVTITVKPDAGFKLADLTVTDKNGNDLKLTDKGNGKYTFTMPAGKVEVKASFAEEAETSPFADVAIDAYCYDAVKWAAEQGITGGIGNNLFGPNQPCTRAQIATFLWRAAGSPEPKDMSSFSDVPADSYYAKAVAWAVENGITTGMGDGKFSPDATCTRAQSVTFLFRAYKASADGMPAFRDVAASAYYAEAVKWATDNGITNGIGDGLFGPDNDCTRAQIVTFLWRLYAGK